MKLAIFFEFYLIDLIWRQSKYGYDDRKPQSDSYITLEFAEVFPKLADIK